MRLERDQTRSMLVLATVLVVAGLTLWLPQHLRARRLRGQLAEADRRLDMARAGSPDLRRLADDVTHLRQLVSGSQRYVPEDTELAGLLRQLTGTLEDRQVSDLEVQTKPIVMGEEYCVVPVVLKFKSSFGDLFAFLKETESMPRLVRITELDTQGSLGGRKSELLEVRVEMCTFFAPVARENKG